MRARVPNPAEGFCSGRRAYTVEVLFGLRAPGSNGRVRSRAPVVRKKQSRGSETARLLSGARRPGAPHRQRFAHQARVAVL